MPSRPKKGEYATYNVDPMTFVTTWQEASSVKEVAEKLKMPVGIVHARASSYRSSGINLKSMPRVPANKIDVEALNQHIETINARMAVEGKPARPTDPRADLEPLGEDRISAINREVVESIAGGDDEGGKKKRK